MNIRLAVMLACLAVVLADVAPSESCGSRQRVRPVPPPQQNLNGPGQGKVTPPGRAEGKEMQILAEGQYGKVEEPFLVIARGREVYESLRAMAEGLPEFGEEFFEANAVIAGFLGTRSSGGYGVEITRGEGGSVVVSERTPPKGSMTTMALTQPYRVVSVRAGAEESLSVEARGKWAASLFRAYKVTSGEVESSGGIAGRVVKYGLGGGLSVARREGVVTILFDLKGSDAARERTLKGGASGVLRPDGGFEMANVDPGSLIERPRGPLRVTGRLQGAGGDSLTLGFETVPLEIPDSFSGRGRLDASAQGKP